MLGTAFNLVGIGLMGVGFGMVFRSIAGGLGVLLGGILFLPTLATVLLPSSLSGVLKFFPGQAGTSFTTLHSLTETLAPIGGFLVFSAWVLGSLIWAGVALKRRDI